VAGLFGSCPDAWCNWPGSFHDLLLLRLIALGQVSDKTAIPDLICGRPKTAVVVADRGYDSRAIIIDLVAAHGGQAHIRKPPAGAAFC